MTWFFKALGLFSLFVIGLSLLGLTEVAAVVAPPIFLVVLLLGFMPFARPGNVLPLGDRRKARRINYLGHYRNPFGTLGDAALVGFAVWEIGSFLDRPFGALQAVVTFVLAFGALRLLGEDLGELLGNVIAAPAVVVLVWRVLKLPSDEALTSKVVFGVALLIVGVVLIGVWNLPRIPVLMFSGSSGVGPRPMAALALLELAAMASVPLDVEPGEVPIDIWANPQFGGITWLGAGLAFTFIAVATAYGPRFVTSLVGIAIGLLTLQLQYLASPQFLS